MDSHWYVWRGEHLTLTLVLQPAAKRDEFVGLHGNALRIRIQAPPTDGSANRRLVEFLAEHFGVARSAVRIVRGASSRSKIVSIAAPLQLPQALTALGLMRAR